MKLSSKSQKHKLKVGQVYDLVDGIPHIMGHNKTADGEFVPCHTIFGLQPCNFDGPMPVELTLIQIPDVLPNPKKTTAIIFRDDQDRIFHFDDKLDYLERVVKLNLFKTFKHAIKRQTI